jgi:ribose 5-phosphate isomerase B
MKIVIGNDHAGVELKETIKNHIIEKYNYEVEDIGTNNVDSVDYPVYGKKVAELVVSGKAERGIIICGTGIGISIAANRVKGARASLCNNEALAVMTRKHNDSNILALGARMISSLEAIKVLDAWLSTPFEAGRHQKRVELLDS